ncbi:putative tail fiber protein [Pseudomonas phage PPSC2]|uniref:Putative tail fiber protein n=1 Tax=Pseudomonas phage PPSC2 TaxID=2041350 RepID=A0A2R2YAR5_9CAUD|nr:putative tail fiber protein [Pseudomonas phage PPSC2]ATN92790.1 putative tail fiber protein [Pseudomonas phage PPSC2]
MPNISKPSGLNNIWAEGGTKIDPGTSKYNIGWVVQLPPYEYQNYIDNRQDRALAHINQHGIPEWDSTTEYQGNLSYTQASNGMIYKCTQTNTNKDPASTLNNDYWVIAFETFGSVAALQATVTAHITNYQTLSGIGNVAAARANLSVYSRVESDTRFAGLNGNSSQVFSVGVATQPEHAVRLGQVSSLLTQATESNLGVVRLATSGLTEQGTDDLTAITPLKANNVFLKKTGNLAGLSNPATARVNLGLGSAAVQPLTAFLQPSNNLSDVSNAGTARANLGITSTATQPEAYFLRSGQNLADLGNVTLARSNLGLGTSATRNIGTLAGSVAAGDDSRIVLATPNTRTVSAGPGMVGGGNLASNIALALGLPSTLSGVSTNTVTETSHSHAIDVNNLFTDKLLADNGYINLGGLTIQWGNIPATTSNSVYIPVPFPKAFGSKPFICGVLGSVGIIGVNSDNGAVAWNITRTGFTAYVAWDYGTAPFPLTWIAIGV